jgi:hypothetical protein
VSLLLLDILVVATRQACGYNRPGGGRTGGPWIANYLSHANHVAIEIPRCTSSRP